MIQQNHPHFYKEAQNASTGADERLRRGLSMLLYGMGIGFAEGTQTQACDPKKAVDFYQEAAMIWENPYALYAIAVSYANGKGVPLSHETACEYYTHAAALGHAPSLYHLGLCSQYGWGMEEDAYQARDYFQKAAALGNRDAEEALRKMDLCQ